MCLAVPRGWPGSGQPDRRRDRQDGCAGDRLRRRLGDTSARLGLDVAGSGLGSIGGIAFTADPIRHEETSARRAFDPVPRRLLDAGALLGPGGLFALATAVDDRALRVSDVRN